VTDNNTDEALDPDDIPQRTQPSAKAVEMFQRALEIQAAPAGHQKPVVIGPGSVPSQFNGSLNKGEGVCRPDSLIVVGAADRCDISLRGAF
jgi:hypothetical protein